MSIDRADRLGQRLKKKNYTPSHVCEVGVYLPETCSVRPFILEGKRASLVEANPIMVEKIRNAFKSFPNTQIFPFAVADRPGVITLYDRGASTFISTVESPALVNDRYQKSDADRFEVEARTFDQIDDGTIDVLCIDIEGAEWFVLSKLVSKPSVIAVETHGKYYLNPKLTEIKKWMSDRGYKVWYKDKSDSVFVKPESLPISGWEGISRLSFDLYLSFRRLKGYLKGKAK